MPLGPHLSISHWAPNLTGTPLLVEAGQLSPEPPLTSVAEHHLRQQLELPDEDRRRLHQPPLPLPVPAQNGAGVGHNHVRAERDPRRVPRRSARARTRGRAFCRRRRPCRLLGIITPWHVRGVCMPRCVASRRVCSRVRVCRQLRGRRVQGWCGVAVRP